MIKREVAGMEWRDLFASGIGHGSNFVQKSVNPSEISVIRLSLLLAEVDLCCNFVNSVSNHDRVTLAA